MSKKLTYAQKEQITVQKGDPPSNLDNTEAVEIFSEEVQKESNSEVVIEKSKMDSEENGDYNQPTYTSF
jgi:hypothetical protein